MVRMWTSFLAGLLISLPIAFLGAVPSTQAQQSGNDGDCDDIVIGPDGGDLQLQLGCVRSQTNNLTVIYQADVIRRVVGSRLAEPVALCPDDNCTEENGLRISAVADVPVAAQRLWNVWADGKNTWIDPNHHDLMPTRGDLFNGSLGIDYKVSDRFVLGLVTSFESSNMKTGGIFSGKTDSEGYGGGAYAGLTLADNLVMNAMAVGTWLDTNNNYAGVTGNIDSRRVQLSAGLTKYWYVGQTRITPSVQVSWSEESLDSYVDSTATLNPNQKIESAIATPGLTLGHTIALANGRSVEPWVAGYLDWTIFSEIRTSGLGKTDLGEFLDGRIQAGFNWNLADNIQLMASGEIGGLISREQDTYAGEVNLAIQF